MRRASLFVGAARRASMYRSIFKTVHSGEESPDHVDVLAKHAMTYDGVEGWNWMLKVAREPISDGRFYPAQRAAIRAASALGARVVLQTKGDSAHERGLSGGHLIDLLDCVEDLGEEVHAVLLGNEPERHRVGGGADSEEGVLRWWAKMTGQLIRYMAKRCPHIERWVGATSNWPLLKMFIEALDPEARSLVNSAVAHNYRADPRLPGLFNTDGKVSALLGGHADVVNGETHYGFVGGPADRRDPEHVLLAYAVAMNIRHAERDQLCFDFNLSDKPGQTWDGTGYFDGDGEPKEAYQAHSRFLSKVQGDMHQVFLLNDSNDEFGPPGLHAGAWTTGGSGQLLLVNSPSEPEATATAWAMHQVDGSFERLRNDPSLNVTRLHLQMALQGEKDDTILVSVPQAMGSVVKLSDAYNGASLMDSGHVHLPPHSVALVEVQR